MQGTNDGESVAMESGGIHDSLLKSGTAIVVAVALLLAACSRQEADWSRTRAGDSIAAYQQYLDDYPHGLHAREAVQRMKQLVDEHEWLRAARLDTPEAYQVYLGGHPEGSHAAEARDRLADFMLLRTPAGDDADTPATAPTALRGPSGTLEALAAGSEEFRVQLGAYLSESQASAAWTRLASAHAAALGRLIPHVDRVDRDGKTLWRLQAGPLAEARARAVCAELRGRGADCVAVRGASGQP